MRTATKLLTFTLTFQLVFAGLTSHVHGAMISADQAMQAQQGAPAGEIERWLSQSVVQAKLTALGVTPEQARQRVATLTDTELRAMAERLEHMPAGGGALEVLGIVFLVLLVLELVGVTDVFKRL